MWVCETQQICKANQIATKWSIRKETAPNPKVYKKKVAFYSPMLKSNAFS